MTKTCFKCGETKPLTEFYKHPRMADGRVNKCKDCNKKDVRENRREKIDYYREYDRRRGNRQGRGYYVAHRERFPRSHEARTAVNNAVRDGKITKPERCESCGEAGRLHGHHDDYAKPLDVRWLCPPCHKQWHDANGPGANAGTDSEEGSIDEGI